MKILIKSLLALFATSALLVLMCAAFLYGWVIPHMDSLRPRIEVYLSEQVGHTVQIENIAAEASGLLPSFDLKGIRILDATGQPTLQLGRVQVSLAPLSLLTFRMDSLTIDALELEVTRDAAGMLTVAGVSVMPKATPSKGLEWLLSQKEITLTNSTVHWLDAQPHLFGASNALPEATFKNVFLTLKNGIRSHDIELQATPPVGFGRSLQVIGGFTQPLLETRASHWQAWSGSLRAKAEDIPSFAKQLTAELTLPATTLVATGEHIPLAALAPFTKMLGHPLPMSPEQSTALKEVRGEMEQVTLHLLDANKPTFQARVQTKLASPDAAGDFDIAWTSKDGTVQNGIVDAKGRLAHIDLAALHKYLPESISPVTRQSLQSMLQKGVAKDVTFSIKGAAKDFPFADPKTGTLRMQGKISDGQLALAHFPALTQTKSLFDLNGLQLHFDDVQTVIADLPTQGSIHIHDLRKPELDIHAEANGAIASWLELINTTQLKAMTNGALATSKGTGAVNAQFQLSLPIGAVAQSKVSGSVQFLDNSLTLSSASVPLTHIKGKINFSTVGSPAFQLHNLHATLLGGAVQVTGDSQRITGHGTVDADALKAWKAYPQIQGRLHGSVPYHFALDLQGLGGLVVESSLVGLQLDLPAPLTKPAATAWPLRYTQTPVGTTQDRIELTLSNLVAAEFIREKRGVQEGGAVKVLRGNFALGVGGSSVLPALGVSAHLRLDELDVDAWRTLLASTNVETDTSTPENSVVNYLPNQIAAEVTTLKVAHRHFENIVLGASKIGSTWRMNAEARDFSGYAEYRLPARAQTGQFYARLKRLTLPDANSQAQIEQLLANTAPTALPALDLVVDDFELLGKKIGRIEINAVNQRAKSYLGAGVRQEWRLEKLNIINPDSELKATGVWTPGDTLDTRRVDLQFRLDVADSGAMLTRLGQLGTIKDGKGSLQGRVAWVGSPQALHYPTLTGQFKLNMAKGQFLKIDPGSGGRFMSVLSLQALPRLLTLDFRDVFSDGFAFDSVTGEAQILEGVLSSNNLQMKSVLALVSIDGSVDLAKETQNLHVLVLPDINADGASLLATLINPVVGAVTYFTQLILRRPAVAAATKEFNIEGSWRDPKVIDLKKK